MVCDGEEEEEAQRSRVNSCITAATSRQSCATGMCSLYTL